MTELFDVLKNLMQNRRELEQIWQKCVDDYEMEQADNIDKCIGALDQAIYHVKELWRLEQVETEEWMENAKKKVEHITQIVPNEPEEKK